MANNAKPIGRMRAPERRTARRWIVTLGLVADIGNDVQIRGCMLELSAAGAYVVLETSMELGTQATLMFKIGTAARSVVEGHVARFVSMRQRTGLGIAFDDVEKHALCFITGLEHKSELQRMSALQLVTKVRLTLRPCVPRQVRSVNGRQPLTGP